MHTSEKSRVEDRFGMLPMGAPPNAGCVMPQPQSWSTGGV
jgi:hypothetical protein